MSYYQLVGYIFKILVIVTPLYLLMFCSSEFYYKAVKYFLCLGCTFCYDYRVFSVSLMQIIMVMITVFSLTRSNHKSDMNRERFKAVVIFYLVYICFVTIAGYIMKSDYILKGSIVQNQLRPVVQSLQHICTYITMIVVMAFDYGDAADIYRSFYACLKLIAIIAICQSVIYKITSFDIIPMRKDFVSETSGLSVVAKYGFLRATAGVGEPKQTAKFISLGIAINLLGNETLERKHSSVRDLILFFIAMFFTFSTTGYIMTAVILILFCLKKISQGSSLLTIVGVMSSVVLLFFVIQSPVITDKVTKGVAAGEILGLEDTDSTVVYWLMAEPRFLIFGTGIANVTCYAYKYAPIDRSYILGYPFTLRRGVIKFLADGGIICLAFQFFMMFFLYSEIKKNKDVKYFGIYLLLMFFLLTCEAMFEVELVLFALLYSLSLRSEDGVMNIHDMNLFDGLL